MEHFSFVILHYQSIDETISCVNSIVNNVDYDNYSIVIVDNSSPNNTGYDLKEKYQQENNIYVIINEKNLGFAKGNNVGYRFAKEELNADFIACINNDTEIKDPDFIKTIIDLYIKEKFHIFGPDIITLDGEHQNPYAFTSFDLKDVNNFIQNHKKRFYQDLLRNEIKKYPTFRKVLRRIKSGKKNDNITVNKSYMYSHENVVLHGSAVVYSPLYVGKEDYAFHPDTFLYLEEHILFHICRMKGYKIFYSPATSIYHKEDAATNHIVKNDYKKLKFIYRHLLDSYKVLKEILEEN